MLPPEPKHRHARYFFHLQDGSEQIDHEGTEVAGLDDARTLAVIHSGEVLKETGSRFWNDQKWRLWVTDETGETVCALRLTAE